MLRILKYLKPYLAMVLISVALLFVQANADLALPDYMSRIVNVGSSRVAWRRRCRRQSWGRSSTGCSRS